MGQDPEFTKWFDEYVELLRAKLWKGFEEYGDGSFLRSPEAIEEEIIEELIDVDGWGFIKWVILQKRKALKGGQCF
jgi:hypothetical protein